MSVLLLECLLNFLWKKISVTETKFEKHFSNFSGLSAFRPTRWDGQGELAGVGGEKGIRGNSAEDESGGEAQDAEGARAEELRRQTRRLEMQWILER